MDIKKLKHRDKDSSKTDYGNVLIVSGFSGMAGAAVLSSYAALRTGAGLVRTATLPQNFTALNIAVPEAICMSKEDAFDVLERFDAAGIGPGMGVSSETKEAIERLILEFPKTLVIDADGLNAIAESDKLKRLIRTAADVIMTPHIKEAERLLGGDIRGMERKEVCAEISRRYRATVILKGKNSLICDKNGNIEVNTTGNPGMATAGSGDVLTGIVTALAGQGFDAFDAAKTGCFVHGLAGDFAAEQKGEYGMISRDIIENIPKALMFITDNN